MTEIFVKISIILFVIAVNSNIVVRYKHEISLIKDAKPNQAVNVVRYNREFVIAVIIITEFDCTSLIDVVLV